jgi:hypothetical protein
MIPESPDQIALNKFLYSYPAHSHILVLVHIHMLMHVHVLVPIHIHMLMHVHVLVPIHVPVLIHIHEVRIRNSIFNIQYSIFNIKD